MGEQERRVEGNRGKGREEEGLGEGKGGAYREMDGERREGKGKEEEMVGKGAQTIKEITTQN